MSFIPTGSFNTAFSPLKVVTLHFIRNATVADLFEEARTSGSLDIEEGGTGVLRMVEIISCKIFSLRYNLADAVKFIITF